MAVAKLALIYLVPRTIAVRWQHGSKPTRPLGDVFKRLATASLLLLAKSRLAWGERHVQSPSDCGTGSPSVSAAAAPSGQPPSLQDLGTC